MTCIAGSGPDAGGMDDPDYGAGVGVDGHNGQVTVISDVNECWEDTDDCLNGATCVNTPGSFYCQCAAGYSGTRCETQAPSSSADMVSSTGAPGFSSSSSGGGGSHTHTSTGARYSSTGALPVNSAAHIDGVQSLTAAIVLMICAVVLIGDS